MDEERKSVLLIDDEPFFLVMGKDLLEEKGYHVITAQSGNEGVEKARTIRPHAILLDVVMPGMDGFETCEGLKADPLTQSIPVIMLTASEDPKLNQRAFQVGADFTLPKSSHADQLLHTLTLALVVRRAGD